MNINRHFLPYLKCFKGNILDILLYTLSAFTYHDEGGNLAGVVLEAENITAQQKQKIATHAGYSETAFVCSDPQVDFSISFFTPTEEVDFCGHATLALCHLLFVQHEISVGRFQLRTKIGILEIILNKNGSVIMQQALPKMLSHFSIDQIAPLLNVKPEVLISNLPMQVFSTGLADLIIPIPQGLLDTISPNLPLIRDFCLTHNIIGLHLFELNNELNSNMTASCRNFAPLVGIDEESATGSACGALACYLYRHTNQQKFTFIQGRMMGQTSLINATVYITNSEISRVEVGGEVKLIKENIIQL
jgi:PhzF family phenazine biosynthesis protein